MYYRFTWLYYFHQYIYLLLQILSFFNGYIISVFRKSKDYFSLITHFHEFNRYYFVFTKVNGLTLKIQSNHLDHSILPITSKIYAFNLSNLFISVFTAPLVYSISSSSKLVFKFFIIMSNVL